VQDGDWSAPEALGDQRWSYLGEHPSVVESLAADELGMDVALPPHAGTPTETAEPPTETAEQVARALEVARAGWCPDSGDPLIGGSDPELFAQRHGDRVIHEVVNALPGHGSDRWLVLEQDTAITGDEPTVAGGPMRDARESIAFLHHSARTTEEVNR
jgi:inosose dehydratase